MIRHLWRDHRAIIFVVAIYSALALFYSVTTPLFETPDEREHFAFVQSLAQGRGLPVQSLENTPRAQQEASQPPLYYFAAAALTFWIDTSDFPALAWENPHYGFNVPGIVNDNKNLFIHTTRENFPYTGAVLAIHLARLLSVLFGAFAVIFIYLLAREFGSSSVIASEAKQSPRRFGVCFVAQNAPRDDMSKTLAALSAACAAFVPQFLFISGAVSNDSAIVALAALALWRLARTRRVAPTPREWFWIGVICAFAALVKVSGLALLVLAIGLLATRAWDLRKAQNGNWKFEITFRFLLFAFGFLLIAGWWYARNYFLYGEFTGTEMMLKIFGARAEPMTWELFTAQIAEVRETFWVGFGWGNIRAPSLAYTTFDFVSVVAGLGIAIGFARERAKRFLLIFFATWTLIVLAALIRWMFVTQAPHGRLFFPALPALAPLFVFGITQLVPPRWQMNLARASAAALGAFALFALGAILTPAYAFPNWSSARDAEKIPQRIEINYGDAMKLLGAEIFPRRVAPGAAITVTLFWQSLALMNDDYSIGLALLDANQRVLSNRASYPGHGLLPTRLWQSGQLLRDAYWLPIPREIAAPALAQLQVTLYSRATRRELIAQDAAGRTITPFVARVRIAPESVEVKPQHALNFIFDERIALIGYTITDARLTLYWQARAPIENDYTVFAHWLDANGNIVAQKDHTPANGAAPTALWEPGEIILDPFDLAAQNNYRVRVGLYRAETGARAEIRDANGNSIGDAVTLDLNEGK